MAFQARETGCAKSWCCHTLSVQGPERSLLLRYWHQYNEGKNCPEDFSVTLKGKCIAKMCNIAKKYMQ